MYNIYNIYNIYIYIYLLIWTDTFHDMQLGFQPTQHNSNMKRQPKQLKKKTRKQNM